MEIGANEGCDASSGLVSPEPVTSEISDNGTTPAARRWGSEKEISHVCVAFARGSSGNCYGNGGRRQCAWAAGYSRVTNRSGCRYYLGYDLSGHDHGPFAEDAVRIFRNDF